MTLRQDIFATPVIIDELDEHAALNPELERVILARMDEDQGLASSNIGGWHSRRDLIDWGGAPIRRVADRAIEIATQNSETVRGAVLEWKISAWANVSGPGAVNVPHVHGATFWSAVYYVRVPSGEGGRLCLHDPRLPGIHMHSAVLRFAKGGPEGVMRLRPKAGQLVLFPAWLLHSVEPWAGPGQRISVAMNIKSLAKAARG